MVDISGSPAPIKLHVDAGGHDSGLAAALLANRNNGADPLAAALLADRNRNSDTGLVGALLANRSSNMDPAMLALMGNGGFGGMGGMNGILPFLLLTMFCRGGNGLFGGCGNGNAGAFAAEAVAAQSITTPKDVSLQLANFQQWAATNSQMLSDKLCASTASITAAVNGITPQLYQGFAQVALQACQNQAATQSAICDLKTSNLLQFAAIQKQIDDCCCEQKALTTAEANTTRALFTQTTIDSLRAALADAKDALRDARHHDHGGHGHDGRDSRGNVTIGITDVNAIASAVAAGVAQRVAGDRH